MTVISSTGPVTAGKVDLVEGDVRLLYKNSHMRRPKLGDAIYEGDSIFTGGDGEVHFNMEDGGYIGVRPGTTMRIVNYKAEGGSGDRSVISLLEGSFRSVTGWIARLAGGNDMVRTPTATIGARGTEHEPLVILEGSKEGEPGTYDLVRVGETVIKTSQGFVSVRSNQAGFAPNRGDLRPRVLDRVPGFFRATGNENRFEGLHERIRQQLEKRRTERRQLIEQRRKQQSERREERKSSIEQRQEPRKPQQEQRRQPTEDQKQLEEERRKEAGKARLESEQERRDVQERKREQGEASEEEREKRARKSE